MASLRDIGIGILVGTLIIGPFLWTAVGRNLTIKAVSKGAEVSTARVEGWLKKAEEKIG